MNGKLVKPGAGLSVAEKELIEKTFPIPTPVPAVGPGETLESVLGPGIKLARARPKASIWNPNPSTLRGQTIESVTSKSDGIDTTFYPKCKVVRLIKADSPDLDDLTKGVYVSMENFFWTLSE